MNVQVSDGLAGPRAAVDDGAVAALLELSLARQLRRDQEQVAEQEFILGGIVQGRHVLARNDEQVNGCLGMDVFDGHRPLVLVNDLGGDAAFDDATENAGLQGLSVVLCLLSFVLASCHEHPRVQQKRLRRQLVITIPAEVFRVATVPRQPPSGDGQLTTDN